MIKTILTLLFLLAIPFLHAKGEKAKRILIILDGSSSMTYKWENTTRIKVGSEIILRLMDSIYKIDKNVEFGLRIYGHQSDIQEKNCYDTKQEVSFSKDNYAQMNMRLQDIHPKGTSPIAFAISEAGQKELSGSFDNTLVLITDGGESCGGNICNALNVLRQKQLVSNAYIICLIDYAPLKEQYNCFQFLETAAAKNIIGTIDTIANTFKGEQKVLASTEDSTDGYGYLKIVNYVNVKNAILFIKKGNFFVTLDKLNINSLSQGQKLKLKPGQYKIQYILNSSSNTQQSIEKEFAIKKQMITEL